MKIKDEVKALKITPKTLREFGLLIGGIFAVMGAVALWHQHVHGYLFLALGAALILPGILFPEKLRQPYIYWMTLAFMLGWVMTRVILTVFYFIAMYPISCLARFRRDEFLDMDPKKSRGSYWTRKTEEKTNDSYHKQF